MPLVKQGRPAADPFVAVAEDAPLPDGPALVSAERLVRDFPALAGRNQPLGVVWPNDREVAELKPYLDKLALVALVFPRFRDGRAFSQARLLRERFGFAGELRATGNVLRDQFLMMARAGFDAFAVEKETDVAAFQQELASYSVFYQPTGDGRPTARGLRRAARSR